MISIHQREHQLVVGDFPADITFDIVERDFNLIIEEFEQCDLNVVLDFQYVSYIDSTGIGKIVQFEKIVTSQSRELFIINVSEPIVRLFDFFKLSDILTFSKDDSLLCDKQQSDKVYIIAENLPDDQKRKIIDSVDKKCVFIDAHSVDMDILVSGSHEQKSELRKIKKELLFSISDVSEVIKECIVLHEKKEFEIIHDIIKHHSDVSVRQAVIEYVKKIKNDPALLSVLKNAFMYEDDITVKKVIRSTIDVIENRA